MNYNNPEASRISICVKTVCDVLFAVFAFLFLWRIHGGILAMAQHVLSRGQTTYNEILGAIIITLVLLLIKLVLNRLFRLEREWYMLSYFPSFLLLSVLCSIDSSAYDSFSCGNWLWLFPVIMAAYILVVVFVKHLPSSIDERGGGNIIRLLVPNLAIMSAMIVFALSMSDTDDQIVNQVRMVDALRDGDMDRVLTIGKDSRTATRPMTAIRAMVLSKKGIMGDSLFSYAQPFGSDGLILERSDTAHMRAGVDSVFRNFGAYPKNGQKMKDFLFMLNLSYTQKKESLRDYLLCSMLLDRNLKGFAREMERSYGDIDSISLPKYYEQALILYKRRISPYFRYENETVDSLYDAYESELRSYRERKIAIGMARKDFPDTYFVYYDDVK